MTKTNENTLRAISSPEVLSQSICSVTELRDVVMQFSAWLDNIGYSSYDPYDMWGTRYGLLARRLYYAKHPLGLFLTAPLLMMEMICPSLRGLFVKKKRYATADAQLLLAFLNLHEINQKNSMQGSARSKRIANQNPRTKHWLDHTKDDETLRIEEDIHLHSNLQSSHTWLAKAEKLAEDILGYSIPNYSGYCWGYPFDWQSVNGLIPRNTPHITATPYCYEAFVRLFEVTGQNRYLEVARSASNFVFCDLNDTPTSKDAAAGSYTPFDHGKVINANAYRAFVLFDASHRFNDEHYFEKAWKNLRFILDNQNPDGSWLYAIDNPAETFIDHFHTCFVLKNLFKLNRYINNDSVAKAISNGYRFYREALYDEDDNPRSFAIAPRTQIVRLEMYNFAEAINLGTLLGAENPEAFSLSCKLANRLLKKYRLRDGHFVTRTYFGGFNHCLPFLRWPQAQLFHAITNLLVSLVRMDEAHIS